jgi:hypothetical protein
VLVHTFFATYLSSVAIGDMLIKKHVIFIASAQKFLASLLFSLKHLIFSTIILFIISATLLCCDVLCTVKCLLIPHYLYNSMNFESINLVPLSHLMHLIFLPTWFSTSTSDTLNVANISHLCRMKYTKIFHE